MKMKHFLAVIAFFAVAGVLVFAFSPRRYEATFYPMGPIPVKVVAYGKNYLGFNKAISMVEGRVQSLVKVFSAYDPLSELSKINERAFSSPVDVSDDMKSIISLSRKWNTITSGAFDPTVAPVISLWNRAAKDGRVPSHQEISGAISVIGMRKVETVDGEKVHFAEQGLSLDFGAIAKGYIVDAAVEDMLSSGVLAGVVEAGGDAYVFGDRPLTVGIQDPFEEGKLIGTIEIENCAVVTSGNYERYHEIGGKRYSHIYNPMSGLPVENSIVSVTVVGGSAADADAMATSVMLMGLHSGIQLSGRVELPCIIVEKTGDLSVLWVASALADRLKPSDEWRNRVRIY